jgi:UDP-glucose 4-epimerase
VIEVLLFANILTVATFLERKKNSNSLVIVSSCTRPRAPRQPRTPTHFKLAAINPYDHQHLPLEDILACVVGFSPVMHLS